MSCVHIKNRVDIGGSAYEAGSFAQISEALVDGLVATCMVARVLQIDKLTCDGVLCGFVSPGALNVQVEVDIGATGTADYITTLSSDGSGRFGADLTTVAGDDIGDTAGAVLPVAETGEKRRFTVTVETGAIGDCATVVHQADCQSATNSPCGGIS